MNDFTPVASLAGGALIGFAASIFLLSYGKVAGISGLYGGLLQRPTSSRALRVWFLAGLVVAGAGIRVLYPAAFVTSFRPSWLVVVVAGLLVGFGTQLGNGCTSGHGVCGISRGSNRSLVATATFMATGFATVFLAHHVFGGGR